MRACAHCCDFRAWRSQNLQHRRWAAACVVAPPRARGAAGDGVIAARVARAARSRAGRRLPGGGPAAA
eukprot:2700344-Prymnesium_polylepis.1